MASSVYRSRPRHSARDDHQHRPTSQAPIPPRQHRPRRWPCLRLLGPSTSRPRRPWPTTRSDLPGSRLAAPQPGQLAGRTAEHDGGTCAQNLTSIPDWMMRVSLRWIACNRLRRSAAGKRWVQPPPATLLSGPHARAYSPARTPTTSAARRARNARARRGRWIFSRSETPHSACARSGRYPSTTLLGNNNR